MKFAKSPSKISGHFALKSLRQPLLSHSVSFSYLRRDRLQFLAKSEFSPGTKKTRQGKLFGLTQIKDLQINNSRQLKFLRKPSYKGDSHKTIHIKKFFNASFIFLLWRTDTPVKRNCISSFALPKGKREIEIEK